MQFPKSTMSMHQLVSAAEGINCHAWNGDRTGTVFGLDAESRPRNLTTIFSVWPEICISPNSHEMLIYQNCQAPMAQWTVKQFVMEVNKEGEEERTRLTDRLNEVGRQILILSPNPLAVLAVSLLTCCCVSGDLTAQHDMTISAIDWHPLSGMIVTCAHDRNAFVWTYVEEENKWNPSLVILRIDHAANDVKWSPDGKKFAVASASKCVPVCHYDTEGSWWVSKMIKKPHKSTVLCVAWHPNSQLIGRGLLVPTASCPAAASPLVITQPPGRRTSNAEFSPRT